jgi:hypothetical protein
MPALVAGIHVVKCSAKTKNVDGRNKSGHDGMQFALKNRRAPTVTRL